MLGAYYYNTQDSKHHLEHYTLTLYLFEFLAQIQVRLASDLLDQKCGAPAIAISYFYLRQQVYILKELLLLLFLLFLLLFLRKY